MQDLQETRVGSLGKEESLEKEMTTHSSILAWEIPQPGAWWTTVHGVTKSQTRLNEHTHTVLHRKHVTGEMVASGSKRSEKS